MLNRNFRKNGRVCDFLILINTMVTGVYHSHIPNRHKACAVGRDGSNKIWLLNHATWSFHNVVLTKFSPDDDLNNSWTFWIFRFSYVSKLSDSIRMKKESENSIEDVERFRKYSPEFFWLIRDRTLKITDVNDQPCDINTYLAQKV